MPARPLTTATQRRPVQASRDVWPRAILLAAWAALANAWAERHLGVGLADPLALLGLTGSWTVLWIVLDALVEEDDQKNARRRWAKRLRRWLGQRWVGFVLVLLYGASVIIAASYGSLVVIGPPTGTFVTDLDGRQVADAPATNTPDSRLLVATNPFGRDLRVAVPGFIDQIVTLYPLLGRRIDPQQDMRPLPTILFRPTTEALDSLGEGGRFSLFKIDGDACRFLGFAAAQSSFRVGRDRPVPSGVFATWSIELGAIGVNGQVLDRTLLAWGRPEAVATIEPTKPGAQIYAVVATRVDKRKAEVLATVGDESWQDILMHGPMEPPRCPTPHLACGPGCVGGVRAR
jgi:hypothetical protein